MSSTSKLKISPKWRAARYGAGLERAIPAVPGVYAIARVRRLHGLPAEVEWIYVGQSRDLRRRWRQHVERTEPNRRLNGLAGADIEFWWRRLPADSLDSVEAELIAALKPPANRRGLGDANDRDASVAA